MKLALTVGAIAGCVALLVFPFNSGAPMRMTDGTIAVSGGTISYWMYTGRGGVSQLPPGTKIHWVTRSGGSTGMVVRWNAFDYVFTTVDDFLTNRLPWLE